MSAMALSCAFCAGAPALARPSGLIGRRCAVSVYATGPRSSSRTRGVSVPTCRATRLLVVELECVARDTSSPTHATAAKELTERIEVDRSSAVDSAYLVYASERGYESSMKCVETAALPVPDALVAVNGSELYQRGYRTPDPLWEQMLRKQWDAKPATWVISKYFEDQLVKSDVSEEEFELIFDVKEGSGVSAVDLRDAVSTKLEEMGVKARVGLRGGSSGSLALMPASGDIGEVVSFCASSLHIEEPASTCIFGNAGFVETCLKGRDGALGVVAACSSVPATLAPGAEEGRIYISEQKGVHALLDGVLHHAVF